MTKITVTLEDQRIEEFAFDPSKKIISLGRRKNNDVCIPDLSVSGNHAIITVNGEELILEDLKSTNGSYVNGEFVERARISTNTEIILGKILVDVKLFSGAGDTFTNERPDLIPGAAERDMAIPESAAVAGSHMQGVPSSAGIDHADALAERPAPDEVARQRAPISEAAPKPAQVATDEHPLNGVEHLVVPESSQGMEAMNDSGSLPAAQPQVAAIEIKNGVKSGQKLPIDKPVTTLGRPGIQIAAIMRKPDGFFLMHIESEKGVDRPILNDSAIGDEPVFLRNGDAFTIAGIDVQFMLS